MKYKPLKTKLMGIINVTNDSFYENSRYFFHHLAIEAGMKMIKEGADLLDIGGESTRPNARPIEIEEELERVIPIIRGLAAKSHVPISIDTMKPAVARAALEAGATLINDITGFRDSEMAELAAEKNVDICVMHMRGMPQTMQNNPHYEEGIVAHLMRWFEERVDFLVKLGVKKEKIILDPGIGFGKTVDDNFKILHNLQEFKKIGFPLLLGVSRKSFIAKTLGKTANELLAPTLAINALAILSNADVIRVHDVKEHRDVIDILAKYHEIISTAGSGV